MLIDQIVIFSGDKFKTLDCLFWSVYFWFRLLQKNGLFERKENTAENVPTVRLNCVHVDC